VLLNGDLSISGDLVIYGGTGTVTLETSKTVSSTGAITIIADDIDLKGDALSASSSIQLAPYSKNHTIGVGAGAGQFSVSTDELSILTCAGLNIGLVDSSGSITVAAVTNASSNGIQGILTLLTTADDAQITFEASSSTFHTLEVLADNGVIIQGDVTTTAGGMYLDGDEDNSATSDGMNTILFEDATTVSAKGTLSLGSTAVQAGVLTLVGGSGVTISDVLTGMATGNQSEPTWDNSYTTGNELYINADAESMGVGAFTIGPGKGVVNANSNIQIIAWDLDIGGYIDAGTGAVRINASVPLQSIGVGTAADMHVTDEELNLISAQGSISIYRNGQTADIIVHDINRLYKAEPDRIVFDQNYWTNAQMSQDPAISSAVAYVGVGQRKTQVYRLENDFIPPVDGSPTMQVPELVNIGMDIIVHWNADRTLSRTSHQLDWIGLFKKGECAQSTATRLPDPEQQQAEHGFINKCFLASKAVGGALSGGLSGGALSGAVSFGPESYSFTAGEYEMRYFLGESSDGEGYRCTSMAGTKDYTPLCLLHAQATSTTITVVKAGSAESLDRTQLPGLEMYQDAEDGAMYSAGL
jgi:hypothetical protein